MRKDTQVRQKEPLDGDHCLMIKEENEDDKRRWVP